MSLADRVIAVSASVAETMAQQGIAPGKIRTVLNRTLGTPRLPPLRAVQPAVLSRPAIVTVCGMNHRKGIAELISAFDLLTEQLPGAHLYLVGDGPQRALFEQQARASKSSFAIHFEGFQSEPRAYMLAADVFVLASRRESFGLVLIEARDAGCAIVATQVDGVAEALDHGEAGVLVPACNPPALAAAITTLLTSETGRHRWQARAHRGIDAFRVGIMASEMQQVYEDLPRGDTRRSTPRDVLPSGQRAAPKTKF
jgi:glycosyltransferase involved in cell wall biosynthesis